MQRASGIPGSALIAKQNIAAFGKHADRKEMVL